jgi:cell division protein FtsW
VWFAVQGFINMGVNMGLPADRRASRCRCSPSAAPGIVVACIAIAILLRIDWENRYLMKGGAL